ncbi:DNA repair protein RecN [Odoribacter sp. OttesenSCG-928-J03]|nr:DNA repair protein RecN [Odoribacter sp. OttesenSCG-928-J03]MDL2330669.1 DNA repair protein RecN [Odoribacter sp. OttesenSCG-928-A06]
MIESIHISNYALIEKTEIVPAEGFSVITGETGAGKSIMLGAIGLTLGQRADSSVLMDKTKKCIVEVTYNIKNYALNDWFENKELDYDNTIIVRREISPEGKSRSFINDTPVNNKDLKELGSFMIDIHSQHQSLLLGQPEYQTDILDTFAGNKEILSAYKEKYTIRKKKEQELAVLKEQVQAVEKETDYLNFQLSQLEAANLKEGEKEELEENLALLTNAESIKSCFYKLTNEVRDADGAVISILKGIKSNVASLRETVKEAGELEARLESVIIELKDLAEEAEHKAEDIEYNPGRIEEINTRLNTIYELVYKYKVDSVTGLLELKKDIEDKLDGIQGCSEKTDRLTQELKKLEEEMLALAGKIHQTRQQASGDLCGMMKALLVDLGIKHAEFTVSLTETEEFTPSGRDEVRFLFSANKNQMPGEIAKVASGGEISRVMLSLKYILSQSKQLPVIILDEIDTGLSGEVAHKMSRIMREMAHRMQVISISHLPQIASAGEVHFKVYKEDGTDQTISHIKKLNQEERIQEIAAMMSGANISASALETARNLLENK